MRVSVVIPTRNRPRTLSRTLQSYLSCDLLPDEIVVVDQSDPPASKMHLAALVNLQGVPLIVHHQEEPSLTRARNAGAQLATGDVIVFSDDDVRVGRDTIRRVAQLFSSSRVALVAAPDASPRPGRSNVLGVLFCRKPLRQTQGIVMKGSVLGRYPHSLSRMVPTEYAMGFFFAVRKELLARWAICWDERLTPYAYNEDLDFSYSYCRKAKEAGYESWLVPDIHVEHLASKEHRIPSSAYTAMYVSHRYYLSYKHFGAAYYRWVLVWSDVGEVLRRALVGEDYGAVLHAHRLCWRHLADLRRGLIAEPIRRMVSGPW
jgi:GT2 family glycosyltransferase